MQRWRLMVGVVMVLFWMIGCASHVPLPPPPLPPAHLYVVRTGADGLAEFIPIEIDRGVLVTLPPQTYVEIALAPGWHTVTSFLGAYQTTMYIHVASNQPAFVRLTPLGGVSTGRVGFELLEDAVGRTTVQQDLRVHGSLRR